MAARKSSLTLALAIRLIEREGGTVRMPKVLGRPRSWHRTPEGRAELKRLYRELRAEKIPPKEAHRLILTTYNLPIQRSTLDRILGQAADAKSRRDFSHS